MAVVVIPLSVVREMAAVSIVIVAVVIVASANVVMEVRKKITGSKTVVVTVSAICNKKL